MSSLSDVTPPMKTFMSKITFTGNGRNILETVGGFYADLRNIDYATLLQSEKHELKQPTKQQRRNLLYSYGVTKREADNIIYSNNEQWQLVERTTLLNINSWLKDIENIDSKLEKDTLTPQRTHELITQKQQLESKIQSRQRKGHSVAFGGKRLQRLITRYPDNKEYVVERKQKRLFLEFMGDKSQTGCNPCVRVNPDTFEVSLRIPEGMRQLDSRFANTDWVTIGYMQPKQGKAYLQTLLKEKTSPITYQFVWNQNKQLWRIHFTVTVPVAEFGKKANLQRKTTHVAGIDVNASHIDVTVVDTHANVLAVKTFEYDDDTDMGKVSVAVAKFLDHFGVSKVGVEDLSHLARGRKSKLLTSKALNRAVTSMRYSVFLKEFLSHGFSYGFIVEKVNPAYTSRNTTQWKEECFGYDRHTKASYLIARRVMGLSIERRKVAESCYANSVWSNEDTATPFNRQPRYSVVSFKSTQPDTKTVSKSLEKSTT